ncbi:forespore capture DNA-binding protein RefZ [Alkalibacillus haloalkaliphilus]|uniref:forespore capture DNA-binding protein RefZ n=1 Tax=Alkalibacillus haloalkaliphilus TaxID=94136 RepID=UPI002936CD8F|nr:forespore capture DNA-binding protein RefZ [Alkalibacillus haloalkaliphilus]MDV2581233.1 forespore capture DNA-binding protein RefZ [Alkalibacillus haloalkaliphilus]
MSELTSKEKIMQAASQLFYYNGFKGTSTRAITEQANVNVSLISYYFKNKQGLLEQMTIDYYENYLAILDYLMEHQPIDTPENLYQVIEEIIHYKERHFQFTCFIQRELSLDNIFIRELFSTYVAKETYFFKWIVEQITKQYNFNKMEKEAFYIQFKSLINAPFTFGNEWKKDYDWDASRPVFVNAYIDVLKKWFI